MVVPRRSLTLTTIIGSEGTETFGLLGSFLSGAADLASSPRAMSFSRLKESRWSGIRDRDRDWDLLLGLPEWRR